MKSVQLYRNIHKSKESCTWSVRQAGKIKEHCQNKHLTDAVFHVNQNGRRKVLEERRKNVHAWVRGYEPESSVNIPDSEDILKVSYNPYTSECFSVDGFPIKKAKNVWFTKHGVWMSKEEVNAKKEEGDR